MMSSSSLPEAEEPFQLVEQQELAQKSTLKRKSRWEPVSQKDGLKAVKQRPEKQAKRFQAAPQSVQDYMKRSFDAAETEEDRQKVLEYLNQRLDPLVKAQMSHTVDWDNEPLPHERNYELPMAWKPASENAFKANGHVRWTKPSLYQIEVRKMMKAKELKKYEG